MSDARQLPRTEELQLDDPEYLVKLLSSLRIVKWSPPESLGPTQRGPHREISDFIRDYRSKPIPEAASPEEVLDSGDKDDCDPISPQSREILNLIFPPQTWVENNVRYHQKISTVPSTRFATADLKDNVRACMIKAQARIKGICPIRENLTMRCFDEMIRLATIECAERGLLLRNVRDEMRMTLTCYKTLLRLAIEFGEKKFQQSTNKLGEMQKQLEDLTEEKHRLRRENEEMRVKMKLMDRQFTEERQVLAEVRKNKLAALKRTIDQFIAMLESVGVEKSQYRHLL